jgi:hypothetical protein
MIDILFRKNKNNERVIVVSGSIKTDIHGFNFLTDFYYQTEKTSNYLLDFSECVWFEGNLCAVFAEIISERRQLGATFDCNINSIPQKIKSTFINNGFLNFLNPKTQPTLKKSTGVPITQFDMKDEDAFQSYIYENFLTEDLSLKMSELAKKKIYRSIFELYSNSVLHSGAKHVTVCGQYYNYKGKLALTMVEIGNTFKQNVTRYNNAFDGYSGKQCIQWAVESGNTTKPSLKAGGLGLDLIRTFLKMNEGKLQINSADGYWEEKKGTIFAADCKHFPGSIVNIEFNLRDNNSYISHEERKINLIF